MELFPMSLATYTKKVLNFSQISFVSVKILLLSAMVIFSSLMQPLFVRKGRMCARRL